LHSSFISETKQNSAKTVLIRKTLILKDTHSKRHSFKKTLIQKDTYLKKLLLKRH